MKEGWVEVRGWAVSSYLLYDEEGVYLIDGGFAGGLELIERELQEIGKSWEDVRAILLTHGHIDHTLNVARLRELTEARVQAPNGEELTVAGNAVSTRQLPWSWSGCCRITAGGRSRRNTFEISKGFAGSCQLPGLE